MAVKVNARSPIYKKYQQSGMSKVVLDIYVYSGTITVDKGDAVLSITKKPKGTDDYVIFEISEILREFLEPNISTPLNSNINYVKWVQLEATIT